MWFNHLLWSSELGDLTSVSLRRTVKFYFLSLLARGLVDTVLSARLGGFVVVEGADFGGSVCFETGVSTGGGEWKKYN